MDSERDGEEVEAEKIAATNVGMRGWQGLASMIG